MKKAAYLVPLFLAASSCSLDHELTAPTPTATTDCSTATTQVAKVVCLAEAFMATLSADQKAAVVLDYTTTNAVKWSNLPCGAQCRNGLEFTSLTDTQIAAALAVVAAATGTTPNEGYSEISQIRAADDILASAAGSTTTGGGGMMTPPGNTTATGPTNGTATMPGGMTGTMGGGMGPDSGNGMATGPGGGMTGVAGGGGGGYSSKYYFIAFLGTPSLTGTWQLQFGGHHLAVNTTYKNGTVAGATPIFEGIEPKTWTTADGTVYAPLDGEHKAMSDLLAMIASLGSTQLANARINSTFSDVLLGPSGDGKFPATKQGISVGSLTSAQQMIVLAAMKPWVVDTDDATAATLLAKYQRELNSTYIAYSGTDTPSTTSANNLVSNTDYARIDGPSVWIEFVCQTGVVYQNQIHYHSVWRDHTSDYGASFAF